MPAPKGSNNPRTRMKEFRNNYRFHNIERLKPGDPAIELKKEILNHPAARFLAVGPLFQHIYLIELKAKIGETSPGATIYFSNHAIKREVRERTCYILLGILNTLGEEI